MSTNKDIVMNYIDGFNEGDHQKILSCLHDDISWDMHGYFHLNGKEDFDKEIENENFVGRPIIKITRMTEENDVVIAEGEVRCQFKNGEWLDALFCDVFEMEAGLVKKLITYQMNRSKA